MSKNDKAKKDVDRVLRIVNIINLIFIPIIIAIAGLFVKFYIEKANRENTKILEQTQSRISQIQVISDLMPYLTSKQDKERLLAVKAIYMLLDSSLAIKLGLNVLTDQEFLDVVRYIGVKAKPVLQSEANQTNDKNILNAARNGLKQLNTETFIFKISNAPYSVEAFDIFRTGKIFANLKVSNKLESIFIDWGEEGGESFYKQSNLEDLLNEQDGWYNYTIDHQYEKLGLKKIKAKIVFLDGKKEYTNEARITIEAL